MLKSTFAFILLFPFSIVIAQNGWFWQSPLPQANTLYDVHILDSENILASGDHGTVMRSSDGGDSWNVTATIDSITSLFRGLSFLNSLTGWAAAGDKAYKTTDG